MHFGENQLSRSLIGLSPLTTGHPPTFQRWWVRSSTQSYPRFNLPMARSPRFGSRTRDYNALFRLAFATATPHGLTSPRSTNSQAHSSKGTPSPITGSDGLWAHGFRYSFTPLPGYFSSFPHGTRPLSVTREYLGLPGGPGRFTADSTSPLLLGYHIHDTRSVFAYGALTHYGDPFQKSSTNTTHMPSQVRQNPHDATPQPRTRNPCRVSHEHGLASSAFARHYSRNHNCFLFQWLLRCFTSPRSPSHPMNSGTSNAS